MTTAIHPYFEDRARHTLTSVHADPERWRDIAAWAQANRASGDPHRAGIIITSDGRIVAETSHTPGTADTCGGTYVRTVHDTHLTGLIGREVGLAKASISRTIGEPVIELRAWQLTTGAGSAAARP